MEIQTHKKVKMFISQWYNLNFNYCKQLNYLIRLSGTYKYFLTIKTPTFIFEEKPYGGVLYQV